MPLPLSVTGLIEAVEVPPDFANPELAARIAATRENADYLPRAQLGDGVAVTSDLAFAVARGNLDFQAQRRGPVLVVDGPRRPRLALADLLPILV